MNPELYHRVRIKLSDYQSKIIEVILQQAETETNSELSEEQKSAMLKKLDRKEAIFEKRYNELFGQLMEMHREREKIEKIITSAKLRLCHAFITDHDAEAA